MWKYRKAHRRMISMGLIAIFSLAVLFSSNIVNAQTEFIEIYTIESYQKTVVAGGSATYNWTVRNIDPTANLTVEFQGAVSGKGWSFEIVPANFTFAPGELNKVTASMTAPLEKGDLSSNLTLTFLVYEDSFLVQVTSVTADTTITGALASAEKVLGMFKNPLPSPLDNEWGVFLLDIVIWFIIAMAIAYLIDGVGRILSRKRSPGLKKLEKLIVHIIRTPLLFLIFAFGIVQSLDALHMHIPEDIRQMISSVYHIAVVVVVFYLAYRLFKNILIYYGSIIAERTASKLDDVLIPVIEKVGIVVIALAAFIYVLGAMDVDLTMFVAGGVFISFVIAFAAQETISNFFSGLFILLDRPFTEGDVIILADGDWCEVRKIGLRTTKLFRYSDASIVAIPNNSLVNDKIANFTSPPDKGRLMMTFGVAYRSDVEKVREIIRDVINKCQYIILDNPDLKPIVRFEEMADSSLNFFILAWLKDRADRFDAKDFMNTNIFKRFNEQNIEIPFPQRDVHLKKE